MSRNRFIAMSLVFDALFVNLGIVLAFLVRFGGRLPAFNFQAYVTIAPYVTLVYLATAWVYGFYEPERTDNAWSLLRSVMSAVTLGTLLTAAIAFLGGPATASFARLTLLISFFINIVLLFGWRLVFLHFGRIRWPEQRTIIVGTGPTAIELADELGRRSQWGWRVVGLVRAGDPDDMPGPETAGYPILGDAGDTAQITRDNKANRVIIVSPVELRELVESLVLTDQLRVRIDVVPSLYEIFIGEVDSTIGDIPLMHLVGSSVPRWYLAAKRVFDVVGALGLLLLTSPIMLVAAVGIIATDGFPILFRQARTGKGGREFKVLKLRTMVKDAERLSGPVLAEEDDPRITQVGRVLRKYRIDELPQLVNVLLGEMSFVGPRPERPFFVEQYVDEIPGYRERFRVKPGVTGLAQVSGDYATTPERKLKYDLIYLFHQNLAMDMQIIIETARVVLTGRGSR